MACNFCPVCRVPVGTNRETRVDRLAERLYWAHAKRVVGDAYVTATPWDSVGDRVQDHWRDAALTALAALDIT